MWIDNLLNPLDRKTVKYLALLDLHLLPVPHLALSVLSITSNLPLRVIRIPFPLAPSSFASSTASRLPLTSRPATDPSEHGGGWQSQDAAAWH
eukprot:758117-Hanusia_phi.AAC.2